MLVVHIILEIFLSMIFSLFKQITTRSSYSILVKDITRNSNRMGDMLMNCLTLNFKPMDLLILTIIILMTLALYIHLMVKNSLGGATYFSINLLSVHDWRCEGHFKGLQNATHVGIL